MTKLALLTGDLGEVQAELIRRLGAEGYEVRNSWSREELIRAEIWVNVWDTGFEPGRILGGDPEDWSRSIDERLRDPLHLAREILPDFVGKGRGHFFFVRLIRELEHPLERSIRSAAASMAEVFSKDLLGTRVKNTWIEAQAPKSPSESDGIAEAILWCMKRPDHVRIQEITLSR